MDVLELKERDWDQWDGYLRECASGTFFQLAAWQDIMESNFSHKTHFLYAVEEGRIRGILPLVHIHGLFLNNYLTSMPGGLCAQHEGASLALIERAKELVKQYRANYLILHDGQQKWDVPGLVTSDKNCSFVFPLAPDTDQVWSRISRAERRRITRAASMDVKTEVNIDQLEAFYPVYLKAMQQKGTPPLGLEFFRRITRHFPKYFTLAAVLLNGQIHAGGFIAPFNGTILCTWAGLPKDSRRIFASQMLYWETIKFGCENNFRQVDLGRSLRGSGSYEFKLNMGAEPRPLYEQFVLNNGAKQPEIGGQRKENLTYRLFVSVWKRLPLWATREIGPILRKQVPFG